MAGIGLSRYGQAPVQPGETSQPVVILGAGLTGLSTALHLLETGTSPFLLVERASRVGGKARSERRDGYTFDITGHWLHLRDERVKALVDRLFDGGDLVEIERKTAIYSHGVMLAYPFQANLHGLPLEVVKECLVGFVEAREAAARPDAKEPETFEAFAVARFGKGIARHFFVPYNTKLWGTHPDNLTASWVSRFVPVPDVEQVIAGSIGLTQEGLGYNARFKYPKAGGIDALPNALERAISAKRDGVFEMQCDVVEVDVSSKRVKLSTRDDWVDYGRLVSTIPLPELVARIPSAPDEVKAAARALRWVRWRYLDVATRSPSPMPYHWVYVPEPEIPFFRVGVYSNALPVMGGDGGGSLYVELNDRDNPPDLPAVFDALTKMGAIAGPDDVVFAQTRDVEYAYVLFDDAHAAATATIKDWLGRVGIHSCGRYGAWTYNSMEDSIIAGMEAASWAMQ